MTFLPNYDEQPTDYESPYWNGVCGENGNRECKVNSRWCSVRMSDDDLCSWHHFRMSRHFKFKCNCQEHTIISGDQMARNLFREYYDCPDIPVSVCEEYCCGKCQNTDTEEYTCGSMLVGLCCLHRHGSAIKLPLTPREE